MIPPQAALLPDGRRLHLQHGPIDLVIAAEGEGFEVKAAYRQAIAAFSAVLPRLAEELPGLRRAASPDLVLEGPVAQRMLNAVLPHAGVFITPMAAVAGAVADEILAALVTGRRLSRAYVNNGGDIALHLARGRRFAVGMIAELTSAVTGPAMLDGIADIGWASAVRGVATSGWGGRSFSLGIADRVSVLAADGAAADAAATIIANQVTIEHPEIRRLPACDLDPDSDLGTRLVTVAVGPLGIQEITRALERGRREAERLRAAGLIVAACLSLKGHHRLVGRGEAPALRTIVPHPGMAREVPCSRFASLS